MRDPVTLPLWLFLLIVALAAVTFLSRLLLPGMRWWLRGRLNRVVAELNTRLRLKIRPFKLTRREVLVDRLIYDPQVLEAAAEKARNEGAPQEAAMREVTRYAREIVPAFNAYFYFRLGCWIARTVSRSIFRVRLGYADEDGLAGVPEDASVVFVINHRSNFDYILVSWLAASSTALSYAVGEWARVWPLQTLIRSTGAFFIRRNSRENPLYRKVLERYVAMATREGVVQAVFPEGRLTRDGRMGPARLGLVSYIVRAFDPADQRDLVFIPVGINYDRVLEDRTMLAAADPDAPRKGRAYVLYRTIRFLARNALLFLRGGWYRFGYACVNFGRPISMKEWAVEHGAPLPTEDRSVLHEQVEALGADLMEALGRVVPVLPVALVASVFAEAGDRPLDLLQIKAAAYRKMEGLETAGARVYLPRQDRDYAVEVGLRMLTLRHIVEESEGLFRAAEEERKLLMYYANSILHLTAI